MEISFPLALTVVSTVLGENTYPLRVIPLGPIIDVTFGSVITGG